MSKKKNEPTQLKLPFEATTAAPERAPEAKAVEAPRPEPAGRSGRPGLRVIQGGGRRVHEPLESRDAVVRVLVEAGADLLLRRITPERAEYIEKRVDEILRLFDRVDEKPQLLPVLRRQLDDLEALMTETRGLRSRRPG